MQVSPKISILLNTVTAAVFTLAGLNAPLLEQVGVPNPQYYAGLAAIAVLVGNGILHAFSSDAAGPLVKAPCGNENCPHAQKEDENAEPVAP